MRKLAASLVVPVLCLSLAACAQARRADDAGGPDAAWLADASDPGGPADAAEVAPPDAAPLGAPIINEFVANHTGVDSSEFIEVRGAPATDYADHVILVVEGEGALVGTVDRVIALGTTDGTGRWASAFLANLIENDTVTLLLVEGFTGVGTVDLDADNDGVLDSQPWTALVDAVAVRSAVTGVTYAGAAVLEPAHDAVGLTVGGASRMPDGSDSDAAGDWVRNDYDGQGLPCCTATAVVGEALNTPAAANQIAVR